MNRRDIEAARQAGILSDITARELAEFLRTRHDPVASSDTESLRFLSNFNDIFISIGLVLFAFGLFIGAGLILGGTGNALIIMAPPIAVLWVLLEYFAGRRRLVLPSITLATLITGLSIIVVALTASGLNDFNSLDDTIVSRGFEAVANFGFWAAFGGLLAAGAIYWRFRLPFAILLIALSIALALYNFSFANNGLEAFLGGSLSLLIGLGTLAAAVYFDAQDPGRKGLSSDNAFWLHFAAAPQIIFGLRAMLSGAGLRSDSGGETGILLLALIGLAILSLALNRRALIAAALMTFWFALNGLLQSTGTSFTYSIFLTLIILGGSVVLLGAGWKTARILVLKLMPKTGVLARIFPPEAI